MISTKNISSNEKHVEKYHESKTNYELFCLILNCDIKRIRALTSIVNKNEKTPSLKFYYNSDYHDYFFKDFSSGEHGGAIKFLMLRDNLTYKEAIEKINTLLNKPISVKYDKNNIVKKEIEYTYTIDEYNDDDIEYWSRYNITQDLLIEHNVYPIKNVIINNVKYNNRWIGYFNNYGKIMQLYAPKNSVYNDSDKKLFMTIYSNAYYYVNNNTDTIIVTKSIKDLLVWITFFKNKYSYITWMGENINYAKRIEFNILMSKYKNKYINFDNDNAGIKKMKELSKRYNMNVLVSAGYKNISDYVEENNIKDNSDTTIIKRLFNNYNL